uniref:glycosyltransferase family 2 protein n=1 Tax=Pedobacter schmidteae TaxID=2201271 RepID=UPI000EB3D230|nr:glycosyltransferase family 2 protein [Pedobacter schmidteae]
MVKVSVIIPNFNHAPYLKKRIDSVLAQSYQEIEVILLDDRSTDNSVNILESYRQHPKISHIHYNHQNSKSTFKQWAMGIKLAKGAYIWIAESDDFCEPFFLATLISQLEGHPNIGLAYCKSLPVNAEDYIFDDSDQWMKRVHQTRWETDFINNGSQECVHFLSVQCTIPNVSAVLFKRETLENLELEHIPYLVCGDWFTYIKILKKYDIAYTALPLNYHRSHSGNVRTKNQHRLLLEQLSVMAYLNSNFKVSRSKPYNTSVEEKLSFWLAGLRKGQWTVQENYQIIRLLMSTDRLFPFRLLKVALLKIMNVKVGF